MSWSVSMIGTPAGVKAKLESYGEGLYQQSRDEYEAAKPHLIGLVDQNVGPLVKLNATGHAYSSKDGKASACSVSLDPFYGEFLGDPEREGEGEGTSRAVGA